MYWRVIWFVFAMTTINASPAMLSSDEDEELSVISGWLQGKNTSTGELEKIIFNNDTGSEFIVEQLKDVSVHCEAQFPVELNFQSHGGFKLLATGSGSSSKSFSNGTHDIHVQKYTTYAHLVSLREAYTGLYTCRGRSSDKKANVVSAFIYVPTKQLFVSSKSEPLSSLGLTTVRIPCPISDPNAKVTLVQAQDDQTLKPLPDVYDPRSGFTLEGPSIIGTFYCLAQGNESMQALEFRVTNESLRCTQRCSANAACKVVNDQQVCECKPNYEQTYVSNKCIFECKADKYCPRDMSCLPQDSGSFLTDLLISEEGRQGDVDEDGEIKGGECKNPCLYGKSSCLMDGKECQVVEHKPVCK